MNGHDREYRREGKLGSLSFVPTLLLAIGILLSPTLLLAQPSQPRSIAFFGRVEGVDSERKVVTVKHGKIPDYMDARQLNTQSKKMLSLSGFSPATIFARLSTPTT